jgi:hypothetical protein
MKLTKAIKAKQEYSMKASAESLRLKLAFIRAQKILVSAIFVLYPG